MFVTRADKKATLGILGKKLRILQEQTSIQTDLKAMKKAELVEFGKSIDLEISSKLKKDELIKAIESDPKFLKKEREKAFIDGIQR